MTGAKLITYLVERLRVLRKIPTGSNIISLLRSLEKLDLELIINIGEIPIWKIEAENFLLIQTFSNIYGLRYLESNGKDIKFDGLTLSIENIRTAIEKKVPYTKIKEWYDDYYYGDFWGTLEEYLDKK